jgi:hypothetical protein
VSAPFTARRAVELIVEDVERVAHAIRASGMPVTEAHYERLLEARLADFAIGELPADAARYFVEQAVAGDVQQYMDAEVEAGRAERLPDGNYRRLPPMEAG